MNTNEPTEFEMLASQKLKELNQHTMQEELIKNTLSWISIVIILYFITFTLLGVLESSQKREFNLAKGCVYKSYLSLYNPAFRFGCALARDRTN